MSLSTFADENVGTEPAQPRLRAIWTLATEATVVQQRSITGCALALPALLEKRLGPCQVHEVPALLACVDEIGQRAESDRHERDDDGPCMTTGQGERRRE